MVWLFSFLSCGCAGRNATKDQNRPSSPGRASNAPAPLDLTAVGEQKTNEESPLSRQSSAPIVETARSDISKSTASNASHNNSNNSILSAQNSSAETTPSNASIKKRVQFGPKIVLPSPANKSVPVFFADNNSDESETTKPKSILKHCSSLPNEHALAQAKYHLEQNERDFSDEDRALTSALPKNDSNTSGATDDRMKNSPPPYSSGSPREMTGSSPTTEPQPPPYDSEPPQLSPRNQFYSGITVDGKRDSPPQYAPNGVMRQYFRPQPHQRTHRPLSQHNRLGAGPGLEGGFNLRDSLNKANSVDSIDWRHQHYHTHAGHYYPNQHYQQQSVHPIQPYHALRGMDVRATGSYDFLDYQQRQHHSSMYPAPRLVRTDSGRQQLYFSPLLHGEEHMRYTPSDIQESPRYHGQESPRYQGQDSPRYQGRESPRPGQSPALRNSPERVTITADTPLTLKASSADDAVPTADAKAVAADVKTYVPSNAKMSSAEELSAAAEATIAASVQKDINTEAVVSVGSGADKDPEHSPEDHPQQANADNAKAAAADITAAEGNVKGEHQDGAVDKDAIDEEDSHRIADEEHSVDEGDEGAEQDDNALTATEEQDLLQLIAEGFSWTEASDLIAVRRRERDLLQLQQEQEQLRRSQEQQVQPTYHHTTYLLQKQHENRIMQQQQQQQQRYRSSRDYHYGSSGHQPQYASGSSYSRNSSRGAAAMANSNMFSAPTSSYPSYSGSERSSSRKKPAADTDRPGAYHSTGNPDSEYNLKLKNKIHDLEASDGRSSHRRSSRSSSSRHRHHHSSGSRSSRSRNDDSQNGYIPTAVAAIAADADAIPRANSDPTKSSYADDDVHQAAALKMHYSERDIVVPEYVLPLDYNDGPHAVPTIEVVPRDSASFSRSHSSRHHSSRHHSSRSHSGRNHRHRDDGRGEHPADSFSSERILSSSTSEDYYGYGVDNHYAYDNNSSPAVSPTARASRYDAHDGYEGYDRPSLRKYHSSSSGSSGREHRSGGHGGHSSRAFEAVIERFEQGGTAADPAYDHQTEPSPYARNSQRASYKRQPSGTSFHRNSEAVQTIKKMGIEASELDIIYALRMSGGNTEIAANSLMDQQQHSSSMRN